MAPNRNKVVRFDPNKLIFLLFNECELPQFWLLDLQTGVWTQRSQFVVPDHRNHTITDDPSLMEIYFEFSDIVVQDSCRVTAIGPYQFCVLNLHTGCSEANVYCYLDISTFVRAEGTDYVAFQSSVPNYRTVNGLLFVGTLVEEEDPVSRERVARFKILARINLFFAALFNPGFQVDAASNNFSIT